MPLPAPVVYDVQPNASLNNRFRPPPGLRTEAVLSIDDDILVPCDEVQVRSLRSLPDTGCHSWHFQLALPACSGSFQMFRSPLPHDRCTFLTAPWCRCEVPEPGC
jgi:hypothetical protein